MTIRRAFATTSAAVLLLVSLTACFGGSPITGGGGDPDTETFDISGTNWSGTDSDGDEWTFEFQTDGGLAFSYNGSSYDDDSDTWNVSGDTLDFQIVFVDGTYDFTGPLDDSTINLDGTWPGGTFTLPITQD